MPFRARVSDGECEPRQDDERNANELSDVNKAAPSVDDGTPETLESFLKQHNFAWRQIPLCQEHREAPSLELGPSRITCIL